MKNAGIAGGLVAIGIGLTTIGLSNFNSAPQAYAVMPTAVVEAGPEEPTIVWYGNQSGPSTDGRGMVFRAWSNGLVEGMQYQTNEYQGECVVAGYGCYGTWVVLSSPTEGMNAAAFGLRKPAIMCGEARARRLRLFVLNSCVATRLREDSSWPFSFSRQFVSGAW